MDNGSDLLMLSGVVALCADCGAERIFVPVGAPVGGPVGAAVGGSEFCCTACDAAVFLLEVLDNTGAPHARVA